VLVPNERGIPAARKARDASPYLVRPYATAIPRHDAADIDRDEPLLSTENPAAKHPGIDTRAKEPMAPSINPPLDNRYYDFLPGNSVFSG
jgi:hypothetical protein